jgi:uncharacterized protein YbjQ (UPF0145 family)
MKIRSTTLALAISASLLAASAAQARDTFHDQPVQGAKDSRYAKSLLPVPFYMAGEKHPKVAKTLGTWPTNQRTNAFNKSDEDACNLVFLDAIIQLQKRAQAEGGDAVIDIKSTTKNNDLTSATEFRCDAGAVIANVALTGTVVKLGGK